MSTNIPNNSENDLSFLEKKDANALSGKDIFFTILRNLHWLILCAAIGGAIAWFLSDRADRIYESHAKIIINSVTRNRLTNGMTMWENITNRRIPTTLSAINDEIIILKSEAPMLEVANRLNLGMDYKYQTKVVKRMKDLYKESPIEVFLPDLKETDYASMAITVAKDSSLSIQIGEYDPVTKANYDVALEQANYFRLIREAIRGEMETRLLQLDESVLIWETNFAKDNEETLD